MSRVYNWSLKYDIERVNGSKMPKEDGIIRGVSHEAIKGELKKMAMIMAERYDFSRVTLLAEDVSGTRKERYDHVGPSRNTYGG